MKKLIFLFGLLSAYISYSQDNQEKVYSTSGGEIIFSGAAMSIGGNEPNNVVRFSPVFNFQNLVNYDAAENIGFFTGLTFRNVGLVWDDPTTGNRKKARTYNLGIPVGIKLGNFEKSFIYGGYEIEFPFHYKEKEFQGDTKLKSNAWFSKKVESVQQAVMVGIQFPYGANLKFKYYLTNFFNEGYSDGSGTPYAGYDVNVFYVSLNFNLLKNTGFYYKDY